VAVKTTKENMLEIDVSILPSGVYFYVLLLPGKVYKGKLSVVH
jgi:hypothetical protein